jgi:hypothetical protein
MYNLLKQGVSCQFPPLTGHPSMKACHSSLIRQYPAKGMPKKRFQAITSTMVVPVCNWKGVKHL